MAKLKPWYQVVTPREDLRDNRPLLPGVPRLEWATPNRRRWPGCEAGCPSGVC